MNIYVNAEFLFKIWRSNFFSLNKTFYVLVLAQKDDFFKEIIFSILE